MKNLLFITRAYPPLTGGLEQYCYDFYHEMEKYANITLLTKKKNEETITFLVRCLLYIIKNKREFSRIHLGDGLLIIMVKIIKFFYKPNISVTIHGLEILHNIPFYQQVIKWNFPSVDVTICVSENTKKEAKKRNANNIIVIPNAIRTSNNKKTTKKKVLEKKYNCYLDKKILFSIGRLVKRKGNLWFVENVIPKLKEYTYIIAGDGDEKQKIETVIKNKKFRNVHVIGKISNEDKRGFFEIADWFVMPNIRVKNDAEGFGITIIEAGIQGCPTIASKVDGIPSAIIDKKTGFLIKEKNTEKFIETIRNKKLQREQVKKEVIKTYNWEYTGKEYAKNMGLID